MNSFLPSVSLPLVFSFQKLLNPEKLVARKKTVVYTNDCNKNKLIFLPEIPIYPPQWALILLSRNHFNRMILVSTMLIQKLDIFIPTISSKGREKYYWTNKLQSNEDIPPLKKCLAEDTYHASWSNVTLQIKSFVRLYLSTCWEWIVGIYATRLVISFSQKLMIASTHHCRILRS